MLKQKSFTFFCSCPPKTEALLQAELSDLARIKNVTMQKGGLLFEAKIEDAIAICVKSRIPSRIYLKLHEFKFKDTEELLKLAGQYPWNTWQTEFETFRFDTVAERGVLEDFKNPQVIGLKLKDAMVDFFRRTTGKRPSVDKTNPSYSYYLHVKKIRGLFIVNLYLDLCGDPLSHRGYRLPDQIAPLRENLAAALLRSIDWNKKSEWLFDPMCGSGTLVIEAAFIKLGVSPRVARLKNMKERSFAFGTQKWFKENKHLVAFFKEILTRELAIASKLIKASEHLNIYGGDEDSLTVKSVHSTLKFLGIAHLVNVARKNALTTHPPQANAGVLITNPPYGERIGEVEALEKMYYEFGETLKNNFKNSKAYIFTGNPELRKKIALKTAEKKEFFNGNIECRLLRYNLY